MSSVDPKPDDRVLIVDDDPEILRLIERILAASPEVAVRTALSGAEAIGRMSAERFDAVLLDMVLPDRQGLQLLQELRRIDPEVPIVVMTGHASYSVAVAAIKEGAFDFTAKPFDHIDLLRLTIERALRHGRLIREKRSLETSLQGLKGARSLVGSSAVLTRLLHAAERVAASGNTALILGESGTGKEMLARYIHDSGPRGANRFVVVDCGAISGNLVESELFGHVRGAFTGALNPSSGLIRAADGGTLFIDEIGELPLELQTRLLRFLQERTVRPVGGNQAVAVDVQVLAATNRDLEALVTQGRFRQDLYYRLSVITLTPPPLRDRREDIPALLGHFLHKYRRGAEPLLSIGSAVLERLLDYDWPGNIRELENLVLRWTTLNADQPVCPADLPASLRDPSPAAAAAPSSDLSETLPLDLSAYEKAAIERALGLCGHAPEKAADLLKMSRSTFYRKLKEHNIQRKSPSGLH